MKMHHLNSICFICLNNDSGFKTQLNNDTQNEIVTEVKYVLPELTILDPDIPVYICYSCHSTIHSFYTFKKKCLENYSRLKSKVNNSDESSRKSEQEMDIKLEITEEIEHVSQSWKKQGDQETEVENSIDIKKELIASSDADLQGSPRLEFVKCESVSDSELDGGSNSMSEDNYLVDKSDTDFSTHTDNQDFTMSVQSHMKIHEDIKYFKCSICNKGFMRKSDLHRHMKIHDGIKDFKCFICNKKFTQKNTLKRHMKTHEGMKNFKCLTCNKVFIRKSNFKEHLKIHEDIKDFKCSICNKEFIRKYDLERHLKIHDSIRSFKCTICNKVFMRKSNFKVHKKIHKDIKDFKCSMCNKEFMRKGDLERHRKIHEGIKSFKCSICNKGFMRKSDLERHIKTHTAVTQTEENHDN